MSTLTAKLKKTWAIIRELSGDDAYERYLAHLAQAHPNQEPLTRKAFFQQDRKWNGVKRCF
jgi:uncharacterized short protein YbdD (DUF466 family)